MADRNFAPHLLHGLLPEGTVWENVVNEGGTTHSTGTIHIVTGSYVPGGEPLLGDELTPHAATLFEMARKHLGYTMDESLVVNNGNRLPEAGFATPLKALRARGSSPASRYCSTASRV